MLASSVFSRVLFTHASLMSLHNTGPSDLLPNMPSGSTFSLPFPSYLASSLSCAFYTFYHHTPFRAQAARYHGRLDRVGLPVHRPCPLCTAHYAYAVTGDRHAQCWFVSAVWCVSAKLERGTRNALDMPFFAFLIDFRCGVWCRLGVVRFY